MEDKRIIKTKRNIKATLIELLSEMTFEKISVTEICRRGMISRITFYTHYEDKYALVEEMFQDYIDEATENYRRLQNENNTADEIVTGYKNFLEAILQLYFHNFSFFSHTTAEENPYLFSVYFNHIYNHTVDYLHNNGLKTKYPLRQTSALLCYGLFAVVNSAVSENMKVEEIHRIAHSMYSDMLESQLFHPVRTADKISGN